MKRPTSRHLAIGAVCLLGSCAQIRRAAISQPRPEFVAPAGCDVSSVASWQVRPLFLEQVDLSSAEHHDKADHSEPIGRASRALAALVQSVQPGEVVYHYRGVSLHGGGEEGYVVAHGCTYVARVVTIRGC